MESTLLQANEISCRIQQISEKGLSLLLYVTSRDGQKRLDEKYGPLGRISMKSSMAIYTALFLLGMKPNRCG